MANARIDNGTLNPIKFVISKEWLGHPNAPYPSEIQNGQGASFSFVSAADGSAAGIVYRGKNGNDGEDCDHMIAWSNPTGSNHGNSIWAETREVGHFTEQAWKKIHEELAEPRSNHRDTWKGCVIDITITNNNDSAEVKAKITSENNA